MSKSSKDNASPQLQVVPPKRVRAPRITKADLEQKVKELELELQAEREARAPSESVSITLTGVMSGVIPAFSTVFSMVSGYCFQEGHTGLALLGSVAVLLSLSVSMPHLAQAISILTKSSKYSSIALAIAFDLGVILAEMGRSMGPEKVHGVLTVALFVLMALSAVLNFIAFRTPEAELPSDVD